MKAFTNTVCKLVEPESGFYVGEVGRNFVLTPNPLWAIHFNAYALRNSVKHRQALSWAVSNYGTNLKTEELSFP